MQNADATTPPLALVPDEVPAKPPLWVSILRNPIIRIVLFAAMAFGIGWAVRHAWPLPPSGPAAALKLGAGDLLLRTFRNLIPYVGAYWILVRLIERRSVSELNVRRLLPDAFKGWLLGTAILLTTAAVMAAIGVLKIEVATVPANLLGPLLVLGIVPGIGEEIFSRGILFRVVEDGMGSWIALLLSSAFFGAAHLGNPGATWVTSLFIAIEAGVLLGMAYAWTRSLWFCMGLHAAWNFTQGGLLGIRVSGFEVDGLLKSTPQGTELLSGGTFGAEGSLVTVVLCLAVGIWFARRAVAGGRIVRPFWWRPRSWPASLAGVEEARVAALHDPVAATSQSSTNVV